MSNFWEDLRRKGKVLDEGIKRLDRQWETPHIFISKYGELVEEASEHLEHFLDTMKDIHDEIIGDNLPRDNYMMDLLKFSDDCKNIYEDLGEQVYEIEEVLTEFGYERLAQSNEEKKADDNSSILNPDMMESLEISDGFYKDDDNIEDEQENVSPNKINETAIPKFIATPVIKSVASLKNKISDKKNPETLTPSVGYPQEPAYSPYYYKP
ncbi:uncharacterized protein Rpp21 isoform X1 [Fopius arisanus]|uniref:At5g41840 protein n=1 Tax=Fopius arisanus TaxID=64838 RepID=A0A0C9QJT6_9HYME|nr:PREDICTED: uncharacterized protein LOC105267677 isoform X1 [Fopius arisanus]